MASRLGMRYVRAGLVALAALYGHEGQAAPITFNFSGVVTQVPVLDPLDPFAGTIAFGTLFTGSYTFESTTPDSDPSFSGASYQMTSGSPLGLGVDIGGNSFTASDFLAVNLQNGFDDFYGVLACAGACGGDLTISLSFSSSGGALGSTALPLAAPNLAAFDLGAMFALVGVVDGNQVQIDGVITSLSLHQGGGGGGGGEVPEPATLFLMTSGVALTGYRRCFGKD